MQQRVENECKRFRNLLAERIDGKEFTCMRREGMVAMDWQPVCKIVCPMQDAPPQVMFSDDMVHAFQRMGHEPAELCRIFREDESKRGRTRFEAVSFTPI